MRLDAALQRLARQQFGLVTWDQLLQLGLDEAQIKRRVKAGLLVQVQPGVYAVPAVSECFEQRLLAACLAGGPGAAASHRAAARLWGLRGASAAETIDITVPGRDLPRLRHARAHRSLVLGPPDLRVVQGIPVTRPERTLIDCAAVSSAEAAASMLESAVHLRLTTIDRIWTYLSRYGGPGCRGSGRLRRLLVERWPDGGPSESGLEDLAVAVLKRCGVGPLVRQFELPKPGGGTIRIDLADPEIRFAVELDSARWHADSVSYRSDRAKWNLLTKLGWTLYIATEFDLRERPEAVAADVAELRRRLRAVFVA